jgi:hypothetical protein
MIHIHVSFAEVRWWIPWMTKSIDEAQWLALYKAELVVLSIVKYIMYCGDFFFAYISMLFYQSLVVLSPVMFKLLGVPKSGIFGKMIRYGLLLET